MNRRCTLCGHAVIKLLAAVVAFAVAAFIVIPAVFSTLGGAPISRSAAPSTSIYTKSTTACTQDHFLISEFRPRTRDTCRLTPCPEFVLVGTLTNGCGVAARPKVEIVAYDKSGAVVDTAWGWPLGIAPLNPGASRAFNMTGMLEYDASIRSFTANVVEVRQPR